MKFKKLTMVMGFAGSIILSGHAQAAFIIDDFNVDTATQVSDNTVGGVVSGPSTIDGANIVMNGAAWTRILSANLLSGGGFDDLATTVCNGCQAGHIDASGGNAQGQGSYTYTGSAIDLGAYSGLNFDWGSDLAGAAVDILFNDVLVSSWSNLVATGGTAPSNMSQQVTMGINWAAVGTTSISKIEFLVTGVASGDTIIDNIQAVPVSGSMALLGLGIAGLGWRKRYSNVYA